MSALTIDPLEDLERELHEGDDEPDDGFRHAAHTPCQLHRERVTLICGITARWIDNTPDTGDKPLCRICHPEDRLVVYCPICHTPVVHS